MANAHNTHKGISVSILDKEFVVACPAELEAPLSAAARYLDTQMREIRDMRRVVGTERIAVMAALNITHELLSLLNAPKPQLEDDLKERLNSLSQKIDDVLLDPNTMQRKNTHRNYEDAF